ncbi:MAG TPA: hypothetical protein VM940_00430 [Chthoniobacterales bacterium]|nr:hypothetical protein [Chthoniobacterales bacterium]
MIADERLEYLDVATILFDGRRNAPPAESRFHFPLAAIGNPNLRIEAFAFDHVTIEGSHHDQVIDLCDSPSVFNSQVVDDSAVPPILPVEIDVVGRFFFARLPGAKHVQLVL